MAEPEGSSVTELLHRVGDDPVAFERLLPLVYAELRQLASARLRGERPDHTLQPTALVHEAYLKLAGGVPQPFADRGHFFRVAARAMRQVLVDHARARRAAKRDGAAALDAETRTEGPSLDDVIAVDAALDALAQRDARQARVIELRFFAGLGIEETARVMDISTATVKRDWLLARAWLQRELDA
ncbi:MAG: sigma-70 family RNA polymerase sigma factor [Gemmatimonadetes bacterium]|nr:sigma-70 family RNA polymerase sigma factor [Gemmatimonadota bacterium]